MNATLSKAHQQTYDAVRRHPAAHNIRWHDMTSLLGAIGDVESGSNGHLKVSRNGQTLVVRSGQQHGIVGPDNLSAIRHFLVRSETADVAPSPSDDSHVLIFIDHREAHIWGNAGGAPQRISAAESAGTGRHIHSPASDASGRHRPEVRSYYEAVVGAIRESRAIALFGCGTGASSAMEQLLTVLREDHPEIAKRIVGTAVVDPHHATEGQLRAKARHLHVTSVA